MERYSRWLPIQSNPHSLQLGLQQPPLLRLLRRIQDHQDQITRLGRRDDLSTSTLTLGSTLDDTRQIQDLNLRTSILQYTRDSGKSSEGVSGDFRFRLGDFGEEGRLSDRRKANQGNSCVAGFLDVKARATGATCSWARFEELSSVTGELSGRLLDGC